MVQCCNRLAWIVRQRKPGFVSTFSQPIHNAKQKLKPNFIFIWWIWIQVARKIRENWHKTVKFQFDGYQKSNWNEVWTVESLQPRSTTYSVWNSFKHHQCKKYHKIHSKVVFSIFPWLVYLSQDVSSYILLLDIFDQRNSCFLSNT